MTKPFRTLMLSIAALGAVTQVAAEESKTLTDITKSVDTFQSLCLAPAPNLPQDVKVFAARGYITPTKDPAVFGNSEGGLAGIGYAGMEGQSSSSPRANGCLVYFKGLNALPAARLTDAAMAQRFKLFERKKVGDDFYWLIRDYAPRVFVAFVAPKPEGTYAGHTLIMITEQVLAPNTAQKTPPIVPSDKQAAAKAIEALKKASPEERIAYFGALQFTQCLLATDFLKIEFDKEMGVERVPSEGSGKNMFLDSSTGNVMMTSAKDCIVAYSGTNVEVSMAAIRSFITMRDKNAEFSSRNNGYLVKMTLSGKPHVLSIARGKIQGRNLVRMMLAPASLQ